MQRAVNQRAHRRDQGRAPLRHGRKQVGRIARPVHFADGCGRAFHHCAFGEAVKIGDVGPHFSDTDGFTIVKPQRDFRQMRNAARRRRVQHKAAAIMQIR